jgi:hypothetical protein
MGDRAYAQLLCRAKDVAAFEDLGFWVKRRGVVDRETGVLEGSAGGSVVPGRSGSQLRQLPSLRVLADRGYVFIAQHDAGGDYDAARLVSDGRTFYEVDAMAHEPRPCVAVNTYGFVDKKQLEAVRKYWRTIARAKQKVDFADDGM